MKNLKTNLIVASLVIIILLALALNLDSSPYQVLVDDFSGTFLAGQDDNQMIFSIDQENKCFYFTHQKNGLYIAGALSKQADNVYYLECADATNATIIPNQTVNYADYQCSLTVDGQACTMQKFSQTATFIGDTVRYQ